MKRIKCTELGDPNKPMEGEACSHVFEAETFDELVEQSREHVMNEPKHADDKEAMLSASEEEKEKWFSFARNLWESKPEEE